MIFFLLFALLAAALAVGICLAALGALAVAAAAWIFSSAALVAWFQKRPAVFFRMLFAQAGGVLGIPCGIGVFWLETWLAEVDLAWYWIVGGGAAAGYAGGLGCGALAYAALSWALRKLAFRVGRKLQ